jgi:ferredoxin
MLKAFEQGADGVLVSGCHPGDCHYVQGNYFARRRFTLYRTLASFLGLDSRRLHFSWVSASEGIKWAKVVDDVTTAVREAGPLREWGEAQGNTHIQLPERPAAPRAPGDEDFNAITEHLRSLASNLLRGRHVEMVLAYRPGSLPGAMNPAFIERAEESATIAFNEGCYHNLSTYLTRGRRSNGKIAVVVKACDVKAVTGLIAEGKIKREDLVLIGLSCAGVAERGKLANKCYACNGYPAGLCDWMVTKNAAATGALIDEGHVRATASDPRDAEIAFLESLSSQDRWNYWQEQFTRCIRCYACRGVCPFCYCGSCISEKNRPQWISTAIDGKGNTAWNWTRAFHLAGRCIGCDECARVCPAGIRLDLINRRLALAVSERFPHRSGESEQGAPVLATFRPDDPQEFIY